MLTLHKSYKLPSRLLGRLVAFINNTSRLYPHYGIGKVVESDIVEAVSNSHLNILLIVEPVKNVIKYTGIANIAISYTGKPEYDSISAPELPSGTSYNIVSCILYGYLSSPSKNTSSTKSSVVWFNHLELDGNYLSLVRGGKLYKEVYPLLIKTINTVLGRTTESDVKCILTGMDTCIGNTIPEYLPGAIPYVKMYHLPITKYKLSTDEYMFDISDEAQPLISDKDDLALRLIKREALYRFIKNRTTITSTHKLTPFIMSYIGPADTMNSMYYNISRDGEYKASFAIERTSDIDPEATITSILLRPDLDIKAIKYRRNLKSALRKWAIGKGIDTIKFVEPIPSNYTEYDSSAYSDLIYEFGYKRTHLNYYYVF